MDLIDRQAAIDVFHMYAPGIPWDKLQYIFDEVPSAQPESELITWILDKIWDEDMWELNWQAFPEILCRKLVKLGYLKEKDGEYERFNRQTGGD